MRPSFAATCLTVATVTLILCAAAGFLLRLRGGS